MPGALVTWRNGTVFWSLSAGGSGRGWFVEAYFTDGVFSVDGRWRLLFSISVSENADDTRVGA
jgi:hypothetical protein